MSIIKIIITDINSIKNYYSRKKEIRSYQAYKFTPWWLNTCGTICVQQIIPHTSLTNHAHQACFHLCALHTYLPWLQSLWRNSPSEVHLEPRFSFINYATAKSAQNWVNLFPKFLISSTSKRDCTHFGIFFGNALQAHV